MVKKFNLSEAAAEILAASVASKRGAGEKFVANKGAKWEDEQGRKDLGGPLDDADDASIGHAASADMKQATPPGATPPVGSEKDGVGIQKISGPQDSEGRKDLANEPGDSHEQDMGSKVDRKAAKKLAPTMASNPGATKPYVPEEVDVASMKEDIDALLSGEQLSEEFRTKAATIFEAAVLSRVDLVKEQLQQELTEQFETTVEELKEEMASKVDEYLNYVVEQWMKNNELAIETGLRAEIMEDFMVGLHTLFKENYIDIPDEKVDVVEELSAKVEELTTKLNEEIDNSVSLVQELKEHKKTEAIYAACEGLTQTQVEKIKSLAESVEYTTEEEFADKLETLKESYFPSQVKPANKAALEEGIVIEEEKKVSKGTTDALIEQYAQTISKTLSK